MSLDRAEEAREKVLQILRQAPPAYRTRWRLVDLLQVLGERWRVKSVSGIWRVVQRLNIRYRRGWGHCVSPDPLAHTKLALIERVKQWRRTRTDEVVVLWLE